MGKLIKTQDIDEFSEIIIIPDKAISEEIIANIRTLDEEKDFERGIKEILFDPNETPHGPTEIADIITSIHSHGTKKIAAFILKGKSYPKVSSKIVAHQILKLRQLPELGVAVLAAVGHIQDDAQRDFIQTALEIGCDYLILDAQDISRLFIAYEKICPKDGLIYDSTGLCANGHALDKGTTIEIEIREKFKYTITRQRDISHGGAKRYSAIILTDRHYSKDIIRAITKEATEKLKLSNYYRNDRVKARFGKNKASVVWLYFAFDLDDINNSNWVCRTSWIDPNLDESMKPLAWDVSEHFDDIGIIWNEQYKTHKDFLEGHAGSKEELIEKTEKLLKWARQLSEITIRNFVEYKKGTISEGDLIEVISSLTPEIEELYRQSGNLPIPPDDCRDYDQVCQNVFSTVHDFTLYFSQKGLETWAKENREWLMQNTIKRFDEEMKNFEYESTKIHQ